MVTLRRDGYDRGLVKDRRNCVVEICNPLFSTQAPDPALGRIGRLGGRILIEEPCQVQNGGKCSYNECRNRARVRR
jgi:hypothetical protein